MNKSDMKKPPSCPNHPSGKHWHSWRAVSRTHLPAGDKRGDWHVKEQCRNCGAINEYDFI